MKLIDALTGLMESAVCGSRHFAIIKPQSGGQFYRRPGSDQIRIVQPSLVEKSARGMCPKLRLNAPKCVSLVLRELHYRTTITVS
jgi:hypothetical protein